MTEYDFRDSGFINYDAAANIERELREQYAVQEAEGKAYKRPKDLDTIFRGQAAKLAGQGVESIYDLTPTTYERDGRTITNLLNKRTGDVLREARVKEGWQTDPTAITFKKTRNAEGQVVNMPIELKDRNGYQQWGSDTSVSDMARYGINFVDGTPVFTPVYKDTTNFTTSDALKVAAVVAGAYYAPSLFAGEAAAAGTGAGISGAGLTSAEMAALKGAGAYGSTAAPIVTATAVPAAQLAYPATQVGAGASVVPGSLQARLAELGVQTAATMAPATAAAGSFQAALPSLLSTTAASLPVLDTLRTANSIRSLLTPPTVQQQMGLPQMGLLGGGQTRGVDFSPMYQNTQVGLLPTAELYRRSLL